MSSIIKHTKQFAIILLVSMLSNLSYSQFYTGFEQEFGKNRIQYMDFDWTYYKFQHYHVYFYTGGKNTADYVAQKAAQSLIYFENKFSYQLDDNINFIVYNNISHFRQSNIGLQDADQNDIGGVSKIVGSKVFIYNEGDHKKLDAQINEGITRIIINKLLYGSSWKDVLKNSTLLTLPNWYVEGLISYLKYGDDPIYQNRIKDLMLSGKFKTFNRLTDEEAILAGHALWNYVATTFDIKVIPNILYMTRVSRNIESGFLFVLGKSLSSINSEANNYYKSMYSMSESGKQLPLGTEIKLKRQRDAKYYQLKLSPDLKYLAYATNQMGKYKIWIQDLETGKTTKVGGGGYKLDWVRDNSYPIINWSPDGEMIVYIDENKSEPILHTYHLIENIEAEKPIYKVEKVLDATFSPEGDKMVFSAIREGHTDLYEYSIRSNTLTQLTFDYYDDLNPEYINENEIIFTSNRNNDTLRNQQRGLIYNQQDIFIYTNGKQVLKRITSTPHISEMNPKAINDMKFSFLVDNDGIINRHIAQLDSTISHIDTTIHYRYITKQFQQTNFSKSILSYDANEQRNTYAALFYFNKKYKVFLDDGTRLSNSTETTPTNKGKIKKKNVPTDSLLFNNSENLTYQLIPVEFPKQKTTEGGINTFNYNFISLNEIPFSHQETIKESNQPAPVSEANDRFIEVSKETDELVDGNIPLIDLPNQRDYHLSFVSSDILTRFDVNFHNDNYQLFTGGGYINSGAGLEVKAQLSDLFENYLIEGGARFSVNLNFKDYFISLLDRKKRFDQKYTIERQSILMKLTEQNVNKMIINQGRYMIKYPFNEIWSVRATTSLRLDNTFKLGYNDSTLIAPNSAALSGSFKLELVLDNSKSRGLNLMTGGRGKLFAETYHPIFTESNDVFDINPLLLPNITIVGFDFRKYIKVHRNIIWSTRFAGSTSFGKQLLLYYLGGVDNRIAFSDRNRFDNSLQLPDRDFIFQARATNMRGFIQNSRNGNSFVLASTELRFPVFSYFAKKPIKSDFVKHFQVVPFTDVGSAWTGFSPFSEDNTFKTTYVYDGPVTVAVKNQKDPFITTFGCGLRSRLWGYFVKFDVGWPMENGIVHKPKSFLSLGLDF